MRAGALRHRVTFRAMTEIEDAWGGKIEQWADHVTVWAEVNYTRVGSREYWEAQKANSEAQGVVRIRYRDDIEPSMQIVYGSKTLHILAPFTFDTKNREMHILFKEALD